jgi:hypothetical protein
MGEKISAYRILVGKAEGKRPLGRPKHGLEDNIKTVGFDVFTAVTMKNAVFWNVAPCRSCVNRRFGGTCSLHHPKRRFTQNIHGTTSQKTAFFNIKIDLREIGWSDMGWIDLAQDKDQSGDL